MEGGGAMFEEGEGLDLGMGMFLMEVDFEE